VEGKVPLNAAEGFIRPNYRLARIYTRRFHWREGPDYVAAPQFPECQPAAPGFYYTRKTDRLRLSETIGQTPSHFAYAHHIQRLMITGQFCP